MSIGGPLSYTTFLGQRRSVGAPPRSALDARSETLSTPKCTCLKSILAPRSSPIGLADFGLVVQIFILIINIEGLTHDQIPKHCIGLPVQGLLVAVKYNGVLKAVKIKKIILGTFHCMCLVNWKTAERKKKNHFSREVSSF